MSKGKVTLPAVSCAALLLLFVSLATVIAEGDNLNDKEQLGKSIFFDEALSINRNPSCATCHDPAWGFTGPDSWVNDHGAVYEGSIPGRFGDRKPPSAAYATVSPVFQMDKKGLFIGGNFWDGRATGEVLGNPAADQALGPFRNPKEQALPDSACVVYRVCNGDYPVSFEQIWGAGACSIDWPLNIETTCATENASVSLTDADRAKSDINFAYIGLSVAACEASSEVNPFTSKYDHTFTGDAKLSRQEQRGYALFRGKGMCHRCHPANGQGAVFTDFSYDNLGVPKNPENPVYDENPGFIDQGLGFFLENSGSDPTIYEAEYGKVKVPTLRNVGLKPADDAIKAYAHNGFFKSLYGIVHFYNTRDVMPVCPGDYTESQALAAGCWPQPENPMNVNVDELGNLGLTTDEEWAIVAFLLALSDGYTP